MSFKTTLFAALRAADELTIDVPIVTGVSFESVPVDASIDETAVPPEAILFDDGVEQWTFHDQEIEVDDYGEAKIRTVDGDEHTLDFAITRSLSAEDVRHSEEMIAARLAAHKEHA